MPEAITFEIFKESLKVKGLKATPARLAVLDILHNSKKPLGAVDIMKNLSGPKADAATIYRILNLFVENGLAKRVDLKKDFFLYESADARHHHHIVCQKCSKVSDIEDCGIPELEKKILAKSGFTSVTEHALEFYGICANCAKK